MSLPKMGSENLEIEILRCVEWVGIPSYMLISVKPGDGRVLLSYRNVSSVGRSCGGK
jgi:hypothetical protein